MRILLLCSSFFPFMFSLQATTLHVGTGFTYPNLSAAIAAVHPGDTIDIHAGTYPGGLFFANIQGAVDQWITIRAFEDDIVIFEGGNNAIQLSDPAYLHIKGLIFQHQAGNGFNTDDGGAYATPAHHIIFEDCIFRDMAASGNNDLLKLSGLDHFEVRHCTFLNGAAGGSGIDMVGCHNGLIKGCYFENLGSNSIQCKGGSEYVRIESNFFRNGGQRTLNLGGNTGLQFFRPDTAHFEAAHLQVYANIFVGSWAPIAYVGAVYVEVVNNTIYQPENWVIRILQETVDPSRFLECGDNTFRNNIIYLGDNLSTETNIGPNTRPESFTFSNNLWYNADSPNWNGPSIPVQEVNGLIHDDPLLNDPDNDDFGIPANSPAAGAGIQVPDVTNDYYGHAYNNPPSIGAIEANPATGIQGYSNNTSLRVFPNPTTRLTNIALTLEEAAQVEITLVDVLGRKKQLWNGRRSAGTMDLQVDLGDQPGIYFLQCKMNTRVEAVIQLYLSQ